MLSKTLARKWALELCLGVGFKQVWGICTLFYESSFVFVILFSCDTLKTKKKKREEYKRKKTKRKKIIKGKRKNGSLKKQKFQ